MAISSKKTQPKLIKDVWLPSGIFSSHYLLERLPQAGSKIWPTDEEVLPLYKAIQELYEKNIVGLRKGNEANTERRFIDKVFSKLGFGYLNQDKIPEAERRQVPDYFLYSTPEEADKAFELSSHKKYRLAISIAESKRWDHNLDQPSSGKGKAQRGRYPHQQIRDYLNESEHIRWGILTNGKEWRLYFKEGRSSKFFEIDLEACLEDLQKFRYFYVLFRPDAFVKDSSGRCLLDNISDESLRFQEDVEKDLREKVFKCVEWLGHGFLSREENLLSEKDLDSIYHHSLILLYRILFVLNAEARDLLPTNPQTKYYKHYGIQRIKDRVGHEKGEFISAKTVLYDDLLALFHLINGSNEKLNKDMNIPRYNGGLFDPERYKFLEEKKVGDDILSEVIYELSSRTENGEVHSIDYKGLGERHLGTVYEGLLEHKFSFDKGKIILKNDKGERKATGAYYTPDYIVKYIVENALGPILKEIDERVKKEYEGDKDDSFANEVLKLNICDPAMGSGHFLVEAVQYLADEIAYHPTTQLKTPKGETEAEINYWKRKVVESCIYGVDIKKLAVELAKLSLWLKTVDKSQPLNFLDHHLRCGNSLIGARINDLNYLPLSKGKQKKPEEQDEQLVLFDKSQFKEDITAVIKGFYTIEEMPSEKVSDIKAKEKTFRNLMNELDSYREIANLWTSLFFGNNLEEKEQVFEELLKDQFKYQISMFGADSQIAVKKKSRAGISGQIYSFVISSLQSPDKKMQISALGSLLEKSESIAKEKNFFHWELEFPGVFFNEDGSPKENPGFDCVIGNPPYGAPFDTHEKIFLNKKYVAAEYQLESFTLFIEQALSLLRLSGLHSYITPTTWLSMHYYENLRSFLLNNNQLQQVIIFKGPVFEDATVETCIEVVKKGQPDKKAILMLGVVPDKPENLNISWVHIIQERIKRFEGRRITEYLTTALLDIFDKTHSISLPLKDIVDICNGLKPYEVGKGSPPQTREIVDKRLYDADYKKGNTYKQYLRGEDFLRYSLNPEQSRWISYGEWLAAPRPSTPFFVPKKIVIRQTSDTLIATIDDRKYLNLNNVHNLVLKDKGYSLKFILALLNSKFLSFLHRILVPEFGRVFAEVKIVNLEKLPIRNISFSTPEKERKERVDEAIRLYRKEIEHIAINADKWQTKDEVKENDKGRDKEGSAEARKVARKPRGYKVLKEGVSGQGSRLGGKVYGIREGAGEYEPSEGTPRKGEDSTRPLDSTRYFETAQGIKTYSEVSEMLAVSVAKTIEAIIDRTPEEINITSEWICKLHGDIASLLFPDWAGRFRDVNVAVGTHTPPSYFEVPIHVHRYCDDLAARLSFAARKQDIEMFAETLAFADWRFQWIHPFKDFNGRVGRILLSAVLFKLKLPPTETASVEPEEKERYLKALRDADGGDMSLLTTIWIERLSKAFYEKI